MRWVEERRKDLIQEAVIKQVIRGKNRGGVLQREIGTESR